MSIESCQIRKLPTISDERGDLSFIESGRHVPFPIERIYYLHDIPAGASRGGHAHKRLKQLIIAISGHFDIVLDDGVSQKRVHLDRANIGLYVCPMIWRELDNFSPGSVCLVLASRPYEEEDYYRNHDEFLADSAGA